MENKLFELEYKKDCNCEYWIFNSSTKNYISHWWAFKCRFINGKRLGLRLEYHEK